MEFNKNICKEIIGKLQKGNYDISEDEKKQLKILVRVVNQQVKEKGIIYQDVLIYNELMCIFITASGKIEWMNELMEEIGKVSKSNS